MTTHEQHTLTDSPEEAAVPVSEAPRIEDESTAVASEPEPAADPAEPAAESAEARCRLGGTQYRHNRTA